MAALGARAFVHVGGDYYLCPLSEVQLPAEELARYLAPVWSGEQALVSIYRERPDGERELIAEGYERQVTLTAEIEGETVTWTERWLVIRSLKQARAAESRLRKRLERVQTALRALNEGGRGKKRYGDVADLRQAAEAIVEEHRVQGLLRLSYDAIVHERKVRRYRERPTRVVEREPRVTVAVDEMGVEEVVQQQGWLVYAANAPAVQFPLSQAVLAYRSQYIAERGCGRLKGRPLSLTPMYLERDDHATGLIRLLSIGLRVLTLLKFVVRQRLAEEGTELAGLYAGNPKRATSRPTAELILEAFNPSLTSRLQSCGFGPFRG